MFWRLAATLLLVALASAERSLPDAEESTVSFLEESEGQGQVLSTRTSRVGTVLTRETIGKVENGSDGGMHLQQALPGGEGFRGASSELFNRTGGEVRNMNLSEKTNVSDGEKTSVSGGEVMNVGEISSASGGEEYKKTGDEVPNMNVGEGTTISGGEEPNTTGFEVLDVTDGELSNMTDEKIDVYTIHNNLTDVLMPTNNSDDRASLISDTSHIVRDDAILGQSSDKRVDDPTKGSGSLGMNASEQYYVGNEQNVRGSNGYEMKTVVAVQTGGEQFGGMQDKNGSSELGTIEVKNEPVKSTLEILLNNLTQTIALPPSSPLTLDALKPLGIALQNITLPVNTPYNENIVSNDLFTLGIFSSSLHNPAKGVFMGTLWKRWDTAIPQGGLIAVSETLETSAQVEQVVGIDGVTFRRAALLSSHWNTTEIYSLIYDTRHFEHRRTIEAFLYDTNGDEKEVHVFWEPFSVAWRKVSCEFWVPGQGGRRCAPAKFGVGLVGCQCSGASFDERGLRRARFLIVEESDAKDTRADKKYFERAAFYLSDNEVDGNGLKDISKVVKKLLNLKPNMFNEHNQETSEVLSDISTELHRVHLKNNESVLFDVTPVASLVIQDGEKSLDGLYLGKRWPTDNPDDAVFHATGLRPGGSSLEATTDTEVFAVRITGNVTLPRRASLLLSSWEKKNTLRRYFFKVVYFTQRFAHLAFSAEQDAVEGDGVEVVFETSTKDWTNIRCSTWNFEESIWNNNPCSSKIISSRLHSCKCPNTLFKTDDLLRTRIRITEESKNRQNFVDWDLFNRTSHYLSHLAQLSLPSNQLSTITAMLDKYVLRKVRSNNYVLPSRVLDNLAAILHRLDLGPNNPTAFSWQSDERSTAALYVKDRVDDSLATIAISENNGHVWNSTENDVTDTRVAVTFGSPQNGVGRVALTYVMTTTRIQVEDRIIHRNRHMLDVTWRRTSPPPASHNVILRLKPFADTKRPVTIRSKTCRHWDFVRKDWSGGCTISLVNNKELCQCKIHPNNDSEIVHARFHIASDWSEQIVVSTSVPFFLLLTSELTIQMLIFHTGCALSLFGLVTVFVTAFAFKSWRQRLSNKILLHICSALMLQILSVLFYYVVYHSFFFSFFDFVPEHREWTYLCLAMGVVWSYSYLARWCWMLVMSLLQLMRIVTVMGARNVPNLVRKVSIFAWGGPFIVLGYFLSDPWAYFDDFNRRFYFLTYLLPLSVVLLANLAVFAAILARAFACCGWGKMADLERHGANSWLSIWKRLRTVIVLFFTLEMTWLFELFIYFGYYNAFLHAMSFVVTAFHGFGTFLVFVALDGDAQAGWRAALRSPRSLRKMALLYCLVLVIIVVALAVVVLGAVLLVCLHTLA